MAKTKKRRVVKGIEHGLGGYTNYYCRCLVCTEANTAHSRLYRRRRFAGNPLCIWGECPNTQSQAYGNGLCWAHGRHLQFLRENHPRLARKAERLLGLERTKAKAA